MATGDPNTPFFALVDYEDPWVQPLIVDALQKSLPSTAYTSITSISECPSITTPLLQFCAYESIDFERALRNEQSLMNAYVIRKALIRKHHLSSTVHSWTTKHPHSVLKQHFKQSNDFELDYSEFLDDALIEAFELREALNRNEDTEPENREWWILKPSMTDRGQGIRLFSTEEELQNIFEQWDPPDSDDDEDARSDSDDCIDKSQEHSYMDQLGNMNTAQLRHFVAQPYLHPPLLLPSSENRKFHIRVYVLTVGALKVYVYKPMLALFSAEPYAAPWEQTDLRAHLTNTCIQETGDREGSVRAFWSLDDEVPSVKVESWKESVFEQICAVTGELFLAAARNNSVHFQPLPNAFELFGLDYLVDDQGTAYLLEVNAFPDFKQTGDDLKDLVEGLFEEVVDVAIKPFFNTAGGKPDGSERLKSVLDVDLGRR